MMVRRRPLDREKGDWGIHGLVAKALLSQIWRWLVQVWLHRLKRTSFTQAPWFSTQGDVGNVGSHFGCNAREPPAMLRAAPQERITKPQMAMVPKLRNPALVTKKGALEPWFLECYLGSPLPPLELPANGPGKSNSNIKKKTAQILWIIL